MEKTQVVWLVIQEEMKLCLVCCHIRGHIRSRNYILVLTTVYRFQAI